MKPCECWTPERCLNNCPNAINDWMYDHDFIESRKSITCKECGELEYPDCNRCVFKGSSRYCPSWQEAIQEAVKEVRQ